MERASERSLRGYLMAWGVASLLPYYAQFVSPSVLGTCSWNAFGMLYYFASFNGYLLLGYYLRHHAWRVGRTVAVDLPMLLVGYAIIYYGRAYMLRQPDCTEGMAELF